MNAGDEDVAPYDEDNDFATPSEDMWDEEDGMSWM
jgi:hypothetical protein